MVRKFLALGLLTAFLAMATHAYAEDVYVTKQGAKYHKQECVLIKNKNAQSIDRKAAIEKGLEPCKKCFKAESTKKDK